MSNRALSISAAFGVVFCLPISSVPALELTPDELAKILQIHAWHVPLPPASKEWIIETVRADQVSNHKRLPMGPILISLRSLSNHQYEFALMNKTGHSVGIFRPCAEPNGTPSLCDDGYSISCNDPPICIGDCSKAILAELTPMIGKGETKWIVISQAEIPVVPVDSKTKVIPQR